MFSVTKNEYLFYNFKEVAKRDLILMNQHLYDEIIKLMIFILVNLFMDSMFQLMVL